MFRSILVPLDGSRFAEVAIPPALRLARSAGARLRLLMAHEPAMALVAAADLPMAVGPDDLEQRAQAQSYLATTAARLGPVGVGPVTFELVDGVAGPAIAEVVANTPPDLIVMATHGRGTLSRFWLGSVADHVVRHVGVPVLLLRPRDGSEVPPPEIKIGCILVPLDLSDQSAAILEHVEALASVTQAHITLLHVVEPILGAATAVPYPITLQPEVLENQRIQAQRSLDQLADRLRAHGHRAAAKVLVGIGAASVILEQAEKGRYDLVAMTTHGTGGLKRLLLGSVADKVIRGSQRPVLVLGPGEGQLE